MTSDMASTMAKRGRFLFPVAALLLFSLQIVATFPGELIDDSAEQLRQAMSHQYGDWHPPIMALLWSWLIGLTGKSGSLLVLQQALHWLGFGLMADACYRSNMPKRAWLLLAAGAFPLFLSYDKIVVKDVQMASAFIAAFGLCCWFLLVRKTIPWWGVLIAVILLSYGALVRTNAVFALGPLLFMLLAAGRRSGYVKMVLLSAVVALAAVPVANFVNHRLIGARQEDPLQSLQIYDLVGIEVRSGDTALIDADAPPIAVLENCYTPYWWDTFSPWGVCAALRPQLKYVANLDSRDATRVAQRNVLWREAILKHPWEYAAQRLSMFNSSIYFLVPSLHFRFSKSGVLQPHGPRTITAHDIHLDYVRKNPFFWPVSWLTIGLCALPFLRASSAMPATVSFARLALISGLLYSASYLLFGVATDVRYYYWPIMAILVAVILAFPELRLRFRERPLLATAAVALLIAVLASGYAARLLLGAPLI